MTLARPSDAGAGQLHMCVDSKKMAVEVNYAHTCLKHSTQMSLQTHYTFQLETHTPWDIYCMMNRVCCFMRSVYAFYEFLTLQFHCWRGIFIFTAGSSQSASNSIISLVSRRKQNFSSSLYASRVCCMKIYFGAIEFVA